MQRRLRDGMTLVELLAVIAIIGLLVALLLPAVQSARESARRLSCNNNLKQIGLAVLLHEQSQGWFPDGGEGYWTNRTMIGGSPTVAPKQDWGVFYQLLPYLEQTNIWNLLADVDVWTKPVPAYFCPSRRPPQSLPEYHPPISTMYWPAGTNRAMNDYAGNAGTDSTGDQGASIFGNGKDGTVVRRPDGSTSRSGPVRIATIRDGTAMTLLVAEKTYNRARLGEWQPEDDGGYVEGWDFDTVRWGRFQPLQDWFDGSGASAYNTNSFQPLRAAFGSAHAGSFGAVMADGSVRPIDYGVSLDVFQRVCSRNDRRVLSADEF